MPPQELEVRQPTAKRIPSLPGKPSTQQTSRKLPSKQHVSVSDQNKIHRNHHNNILSDKDHYITRTRHTT